MAYAGQHPERVNRLVIVDAGPVLGGGGLKRISLSLLDANDVFDSPEDAVAEARALWPKEPPLDEEGEKALRRRTIYNLRRQDDGKWTFKYDHDGPADRAVAAEMIRQADIDPSKMSVQAQDDALEERWRNWRSIEAPTLIARGGVSDILSVEMAERMLAEQPRARLVTIEGSGHSVTVYKARARRGVVPGLVEVRWRSPA